MTTSRQATMNRPAPGPATPSDEDRAHRRSPARVGLVALLIVSILATAGARHLSDQRRYAVLTNDGAVPLPTARGATLSSMNSFALALLLGGLRGPLVMILWQQSESQKQEKNLEGVDTQIEWIRMLQPEFDSVHIFQMWNKAYNISVQMASLSNKYITIVDALEYGFRTNKERPHNINILTSIAQVFFDKLGNAQEKEYYRNRVREDSKWRQESETQQSREVIRHTRLDPRLDENGMILPEFLTPTFEQPADWPADKPWRGGADLEFLERYQPFPYGISTFAFAYNYHRRAQFLQNEMGARHAQLSDTVIDSRPALALKFWNEEEWERGRQLEAAILGVRPYTDAEIEATRPFGDDFVETRHQFEILTTPLRPTAEPLQHDNLPELLFSYERAIQLAEDAIVAYEEHLAKAEFSPNLSTYQSHIDHLRAVADLLRGDRHYILGLMAPAGSTERRDNFARATEAYRSAQHRSQYMMLRYFTDPQILQAVGGSQAQLRDMAPAQMNGLTNRVLQFIAQQPQSDYSREDRLEYQRYADRARQRIQFMEQQ